ncbi:kinesin-like protein KIF15 [Pecten maximus]|uniref:kinesin-like protein KIF15 n=1 Tax=Pecten maximus TaxID=6579 RepID=UPI001458E13C|nr:kinesin-like protein KIF15 [Pecten maximus]
MFNLSSRVKEIGQVAEACRLELKNARDEVQLQDRRRRDADTANLELQKRFDMITQECKTTTDSNRYLEGEVERLIIFGKKYTNENEDLKEEKERLMNERLQCCEEIKTLKAEIDEISKENATLLGHQNPKQKIHHIISLKEENISLREQLMKTQRELQEAKMSNKVRSASGTQKENIPLMSFNSIKQEQDLKEKPRMFLSGDFS